MDVLPDPLCAAGRRPRLPCPARPPRGRYTVASGRAVAWAKRAWSRPARQMAAPVQSLAARRDRAVAQSTPHDEGPRRLGRNPRRDQTSGTSRRKSRARLVGGFVETGFARFRSYSRHDRAAFGVIGRRFCDAANAQDSCRSAQDVRRFKGFAAQVKISLRLRQIFGRACACRIRIPGVGFLA